MEIECKTQMFDDDSQLSNVELSIMKTKQTSHTDRVLEELIAECNSSIIDLSHQDLTDDDMKQIIDLAIRKRQCQEVKLGYNRITSNGTKILAEIFNENLPLRRMNLFHNQIDDQGVAYFSNSNFNLQTLFLGDNQITNQGATTLAQLIRTNQTLTQLGLAKNQITDQGMIELAQSLTHSNTTLKELYLWGNHLVDETCVDAFADMLVYNRTLNKLVLFDCNLSNMNKTRLRDVVKCRQDFLLVC